MPRSHLRPPHTSVCVQSITDNIAYYVPRNANLHQVSWLLLSRRCAMRRLILSCL